MTIDVKKLALPKELTAAEWSKNKGTIAKMAGETGLGAALTALATHQDAVVSKLNIPNWPADEKVALGTTFEDWTTNANNKIKAFMLEVKALSDAAKTVEDTADKAAAKFAKSKVISKSSTDYAKAVVDEAKAYKKIVDAISQRTITDIAANETKRIKQEIAAMNKLVHKGQWQAIDSAVGKIEKTKVSDFIGGKDGSKAWQDQVYQPTRAILAALGKMKDIDPSIKQASEDYGHKLHGGGDDMNWTKLGGHDEILKKVFAVVHELAVESKKLSANFS